MEEKLRVAVAGCGWIGESHIKAFLACSNADIVALCDHHMDKMEALVQKYGLYVNCYTDLEEMLQKEHLDGIVIATQHRAHAEMAETVCKTTVEIYRNLGCAGVVRMDYIFAEDGLYFLEVNTIPGMTSASLVPKMVRTAGMDMTEFLTTIIESA